MPVFELFSRPDGRGRLSVLAAIGRAGAPLTALFRGRYRYVIAMLLFAAAIIN